MIKPMDIKIEKLRKQLNAEMESIGSRKRFTKREIVGILANRTNKIDLTFTKLKGKKIGDIF